MKVNSNRILNEPTIDYTLTMSNSDYMNLAQFFSKGKTILELNWFLVFKAYGKDGKSKKKIRLVNTIKEIQETCIMLSNIANKSVNRFMSSLNMILIKGARELVNGPSYP